MTCVNGELFVGLMSGTSMDAIDSAVLCCEGSSIKLSHTHEHPIPADIREQIHALSHSGADEIERMGRLDRSLGHLFADATQVLLDNAGLEPGQIRAIGSHGQTVRHRPPSGGNGDTSFTLQIGDPNTIAERTGITTVADFRRRDIAAGGEGAPLAPAFHADIFARAGRNRAIVNIGGISNISLLQGEKLSAGFDCGPGNTLLDQWTQRHLGQACDRDGQWAAQGSICKPLLNALLSHPYLTLSGPRSTGKEAFNLAWLDAILENLPNMEPRNVQATLAQFTAESIAAAIHTGTLDVAEAYVCGGGVHNIDLMNRLTAALPESSLDNTSVLGIDPDWVEAATFAWLASRTLSGLHGNAAVVTGATGERVLGGIYPG